MTLTLKMELTLDVDIEYEPGDEQVEVVGVYVVCGEHRINIWEALDQDDRNAVMDYCWEDLAERDAQAAEAVEMARREQEEEP